MSAAALAAVSIATLGAGADALASKVRYTLTTTFSSDYAMRSWSELCGNAVPPGFDPPRVGYVFACSAEQADSRSTSSYVARSVRPFYLKRSDFGAPHFEFKATMKGRFTNVADGSGWSRTYIGGEGYLTCTSVDGGSASGPVAGTVSMKGLSPARVIVAVGSATRSFGRYSRDTNCDRTGRTVSRSSFGGLSRAKVFLKKSDLRKAFGHTFTLTDRRTTKGLATNPHELTRSRWTFRFSPVKAKRKLQRWQVEVTGRDRWSWGMYTTLGAGIWVKWAHRTIVEVKNGKLVSATGKVRIVDVSSFSDVDGAFKVTNPRTSTPPAYKIPIYRIIKRSKSGNRIRLGLLKLNRSLYRADFTVGAGPRLLQTLRARDVPTPEASYQNLVARGPVPNRVYPLVPQDPRVVVWLRGEPQSFRRETDAFSSGLPCSKFKGKEPECFLNRGGEIITVKKLP